MSGRRRLLLVRKGEAQWDGIDPLDIETIDLRDMHRFELVELGRALGNRPRSAATKAVLIGEILATARNARLAKETELEHHTAELHKLHDQRRVEQELRKRQRNPVLVKAKKKSSKENTPTALAPHETAPDPSSSAPQQ